VELGERDHLEYEDKDEADKWRFEDIFIKLSRSSKYWENVQRREEDTVSHANMKQGLKSPI
jgi:hypothetical protein